MEKALLHNIKNLETMTFSNLLSTIFIRLNNNSKHRKEISKRISNIKYKSMNNDK